MITLSEVLIMQVEDLFIIKNDHLETGMLFLIKWCLFMEVEFLEISTWMRAKSETIPITFLFFAFWMLQLSMNFLQITININQYPGL